MGQHPDLLPGLSADRAAATGPVITATLVALGAGALLLVPSLWWLFSIFQKSSGRLTGTDRKTHHGSVPMDP